LTNNGDIVNKILRAGNKHEKEYVVTVNKPLTPSMISAMANGVPIMGVTTKKCKIVQESEYTFRIILIQGLNRQIRRMCEHFGYDVIKLERVRIMNIDLKGLPVGDWRDLTENELKVIYSLLEDSSSEDEKKAKPKQPPKKNKPEAPKKTGSNRAKPGPSSNFKRNTKSKPARRSGRR
jgi:23S rRNA pseudouridine2604 synthase